MKNVIYIFCITGILVSCTGISKKPPFIVDEEKTPTWVIEKIEDLKKRQTGNPPYQIFSFLYKNQIVFYEPPQCCDMPSKLYSETGLFICSPGGGFSGGGDGKCPGFLREAKNKTLIWEDHR